MYLSINAKLPNLEVRNIVSLLLRRLTNHDLHVMSPVKKRQILVPRIERSGGIADYQLT